MSGKTSAKIRLVRCPRCRQILPELPNVPVYQCGGCGIHLQAKLRIENAASTSSLAEPNAASATSSLSEANAASARSSLSEANAASARSSLAEANAASTTSSLAEANAASTTSSLADANAASARSSLAEANAASTTYSLAEANAASTTSSLAEVNAAETKRSDHVSEDKESSSSSHEAILHSAGSVEREKLFGDCNGDRLTGANLKIEDENHVTDQNGYEDFDSQHLEDKDSLNDDQKSGSDENGSEEYENGSEECENGKVLNLSSEDLYNRSHRNESFMCIVEKFGLPNEESSASDPAKFANGELSQSSLSGGCSEVEDNDENSPLDEKVKTEVEAEADEIHESNSILRRLGERDMAQTEGNAAFSPVHRPAVEGISPDGLVNSTTQLQKQPLDGTQHHGFRSINTFETTNLVNPSSELSGTLIDLSKSPTTRSTHAYYDDDISSYEETDDQLPDRHNYPSKHAYRLANNAAADARSKRERFQAYSNYDMQHLSRNYAPVLPEKTLYTRKFSNLDRGELLEPTRLGHTIRDWRMAERDAYMSQHLLHQREFLPGYESGSPSGQVQHGFYNSSSFPSQDMSAYAEQEKMKLLRTVHELQEQLNSTSISHKTKGGVAWKDNRSSMYYDHEARQQESLHSSYIPKYSGGLGDGSNWPQQRNYSRIPFSAEATTSRHRFDHSSCSCPQDWKHSAPLPPSLLHHYKGFCQVHSRLNLYNTYGSLPSSPQRHVDSGFPTYSRGAKSDDQRHRDHEVHTYLREKHHLAKRHLRPIAGGAPLSTCPCCLKLLQLPADFLLFKERRFHRLRCGACSEVLKYSLVNGSHLIPFTPISEVGPPIEADEYNNATHRRNFTSTSHVSGCPVSDSDDFTERDPRDIHGNAVERNVSYSSLDHGKERKRFVLKDSKSKGKNHVEVYESRGPSTSKYNSKKEYSEIEELPESATGGRGSPLHRLMGYSSPSAVMLGSGPSDPKASSFHQTRNLT
ncbi:uncharacterized protein LOC126662244 [Mercurialis annua]|uniref:uncharacterized protein LOC126662244 n=1 Tax=Mercurialis annua TaxID=3986 RepID=UPI0024AF0F99|nr:uncharacterized protein LOC126662244 [Mercurialis annua]XP_055959983.1 uncharacterized protein LOC126662244 [Mercurialis annua]XP_055959984.1 uncharacterized protein LOC126662244 [Mercurialis annua]